MFQLIYASTAARPLDEDALDVLVSRARRKNEGLGVTGVLVHRNGSFLHVLEGPEETVRALYNTICADDRHKWVTLLKASSIDARDFPERPLLFRDEQSATGPRPRPLGTQRHSGRRDGERPAHETVLQFQRADTGRRRSSPPPPETASDEAPAPLHGRDGTGGENAASP
ncbi:MAG: hypothetical protein BRD46_04915 [Bacteroidetes bacterium QS_8_68_15]|nr:MAG: hypothetical protein BRD46_04915 [Bacteroidetes bacterium QS_8_68_15]